MVRHSEFEVVHQVLSENMHASIRQPQKNPKDKHFRGMQVVFGIFAGKRGSCCGSIPSRSGHRNLESDDVNLLLTNTANAQTL